MENPTPSSTAGATTSSLITQLLQEPPPQPPADLNLVLSSPFRFFSLPLELRRKILLEYLSSLPAKGHSKFCDCFKISSGRLRGGSRIFELTAEHPCHKLHAQFNCHAKFLPLLLTSRQMLDEFRPLRYAYGEFCLIPRNDVRPGNFRNWRSFASHNASLFPFIQNPFAQYDVTAITPFPDTCKNRTKDQLPPPVLELHKVPEQIWNEIGSVTLDMNFAYESKWKTVREVLQDLLAAIRKRTTPLKMLTVNLSWGRVEEDSNSITEFSRRKSPAEIWSSMVEPLGMIQCGREGAEEVSFEGKDYWNGDADAGAGEEENGEMRVFRCTSFESFEKGLKGAENEGRLDVQPWHCGC